MADFSNVKVTLSSDGNSISLSGQPTSKVSESVSAVAKVSAEDGSTQDFTLTGTRQTTKNLKGSLASVTEPNHTWTISTDGLSATVS